MATTISGTTTTLNAGAIAESVRNVITMVDVTETPVFSKARKTKAKQPLHQWPTRDLNDAADNFNVQGAQAPTAKTRSVDNVTSYCQLLLKTAQVSGTLRASETYGRSDQLAMELMDKALEIRRDAERVITSNQVSTAQTGNTGAKMAGLLTQRSADVSDTVNTGTRGLSKTLIDNVASKLADQTGGHQRYTMFGRTTQLRKLPDTFLGDNKRERVYNDGQTVIHDAVQTYTHQFGSFEVMHDAHMPNNALIIADMGYICWAELQPIETVELGMEGDAERRMIKMEGTICAEAPNRCATIDKLTTT